MLLTAAVAVIAKIFGVVVAPGARGMFSGATVNVIETTSATLAYTLTALLVALVCAASFDLARARSTSGVARGGVVALSGLIVALASPAVVERLGTLPSLALAVVASVTALVGGIVVVRTPDTRAVGGILVLLAISSMSRIVAWETSAVSFERGSLSLHETARSLATVAVGLEALGALVSAAWIGTRSKWRGRVLANVAILLAFGLTWLASRGRNAEPGIQAVLSAAVRASDGLPQPYVLESVAAFLLPATLLLASVALVQPGQPAIVAALATALLSRGRFDVPLQALLVTTSAQWAMLAMIDARPAASAGQRAGVQQPMSPPPSLPIK